MIEDIVRTVHPNRISFFGGLCTIAGVPLLTSPATDIYGASLIAVGQGIDCVDGYLARRCNLQTREGARLDPLLDKIKSFALGSYIIAKELYRDNLVLPLTIASNFTIDYVSQRIRGPIHSQLEEAVRAVAYPSTCKNDIEKDSSIRATVYGKLKASCQNVASVGYVLQELYKNHVSSIDQDTERTLTNTFAALFAAAFTFGCVSVVKRLRMRKNENSNQ